MERSPDSLTLTPGINSITPTIIETKSLDSSPDISTTAFAFATTTTSDGDSLLNCPQCDRTFTSRIGLHDVDAEDLGPLQDFRVQDTILPSQLQYSAEAAEMEVIQLRGLVRVDGSGPRSVKEFR
ncbi:unnamed protein product [Schistocephalus solidus]|uniref:Uncharacterized protein n=1 Tax=Schistocephalus solidus TaxID=70667 RepID=A0A183TE28_SCHSO|nr:unnamed protein product [Schistocephalus solidus]